MGQPAWSIDRLQDEIAVLGQRGLSRHAYFAELAPRLRRVIDNDASCWHTLDPETQLLTSDHSAELVERGIFEADSVQGAGELIIRSEYVVEDENTFAQLASRRVPVSTLTQATRGRPERSARYRDLLGPADIPHELRAAFVIRGRVWGAVHIARRAGSGDFTAQDVNALARVAGAIAHGIRGSLRFDAARRASGADAPGLLVLGPGDEVELLTAPARPLLASLCREDQSLEVGLPSSVIALASFLRRQDAVRASGGSVVTVPGRAGWVTLHGSKPDPGADRIAIVIEGASGPRSATVRLEAHGATPREREVATLLARGLTNAEIAEVLSLSAHTVQDHTKSLFEKLGVGTRQELVARVFLDEYLPEVISATPLTSFGRFDLPAPV